MKSGKFEKAYDCLSSIRNREITINGKIITNPNYFFNSKKELVEFNNKKIKQVAKLYFLLNKPAGYLCQKSEGEKTIYDLLKNLNLSKELIQSLHAVGRLDKDTEGLMILTNDGEISNIVSNPKNKIIKRYLAILEKTININKIKIIEKGVEIMIGNEKYKTKPCKIKIVKEKEIYVSISEGKKRQIRKMFEAVGNKIVYLKRVSIEGLRLGKLNTGEIKQVAREDIYSNLLNISSKFNSLFSNVYK